MESKLKIETFSCIFVKNVNFSFKNRSECEKNMKKYVLTENDPFIFIEYTVTIFFRENKSTNNFLKISLQNVKIDFKE